MAEDISFEDEYEEYMNGLVLSNDQYAEDPLLGGTSAWQRFPANIGAEDISDSESIVSIGDLNDDPTSNADDIDAVDENLNNWEVRSLVLINLNADTKSLF